MGSPNRSRAEERLRGAEAKESFVRAPFWLLFGKVRAEADGLRSAEHGTVKALRAGRS